MNSRVLELTPTTWETMQRHLDHAEENHQKARSIKDEVHELLTEMEDHASLATQVEQRALSRLEQWHHYDRRFKALCESIDQLEAKRVAHATHARTIHQQIDQAHAEANAIEGDDVRKSDPDREGRACRIARAATGLTWRSAWLPKPRPS